MLFFPFSKDLLYTAGIPTGIVFGINITVKETIISCDKDINTIPDWRFHPIRESFDSQIHGEARWHEQYTTSWICTYFQYVDTSHCPGGNTGLSRDHPGAHYQVCE